MKKFILIIAAVIFGIPSIQAETTNTVATYTNYRYGNSFIFVEDGVTFSVYPDGEFDFYLDNRVNVGVGARIGNVGITFNSGYNYNPYVQYDDYGAVIQVENTPIYYDYYGRVSQIVESVELVDCTFTIMGVFSVTIQDLSTFIIDVMYTDLSIDILQDLP